MELKLAKSKEAEIKQIDFEQIIESKNRVLAEASILRSTLRTYCEERGMRHIGLGTHTPESLSNEISLSELIWLVIQFEQIRK